MPPPARARSWLMSDVGVPVRTYARTWLHYQRVSLQMPGSSSIPNGPGSSEA